MGKKALTTGEVAEWCSVHFRTVLRWIERGELKAFKLPGRRGDNRIRMEDFLEFLKIHQIPVLEEFQMSSAKILLVEDNPSDAKFFMKAVEGHGFEVKQAENGFQAGAMLGALSPQIVCLDLSIPGLGGLDVLKMIRNLEQFKELKILVISAMDRKYLEEALALGADDILQKPYDYRLLVEKLGRLRNMPNMKKNREKPAQGHAR